MWVRYTQKNSAENKIAGDRNSAAVMNSWEYSWKKRSWMNDGPMMGG